MKILIEIQANKKHCYWCHMYNRCTPRAPGVPEFWCGAFTEYITIDARGWPVRCRQCLESEVT